MSTFWSATTEPERLRLIEDWYQADQKAKLALAKTWEENIRFIDGDQYIRFSREQWGYTPIPSTVDTEYIPRPKNNLLWPRSERLRANLTLQPPTFSITEDSGDPIDERLAKVCETVHQCREAMDDDRGLRAEMAEWAIATGNAFIKTAWVMTGQMALTHQDQRIVVPLEDCEVTVPSPLQIAPDPNAASLKTCRMIMQYAWMSLDELHAVYDGAREGNKERIDTIQGSLITDPILKIDRVLRTFHRGSTSGGETDDPNAKGAVVKEVYVMPGPGLPKGAMYVVAGSSAFLVEQDNPYTVIPDRWHGFEHFAYKALPGSFWGRTPITQGVPLQRRFNALEAIKMLHRQTMGMGQWLIPNNTVKNAQMTGRVGLKIYYKLGPRGEKPEKLPGTEMSGDIWKESEQLKADLDDILGTNDVPLEGDPTSGIGLETLREMKYSRHAPMHERWERALEGAAILRLQLIAKKGVTNPKFRAALEPKLKSLHGMDWATFKDADLYNHANMRITAGSSYPQSRVAKLDFLRQFGEAGLLGDVVNDPLRNQMFLQQFHITEFKTRNNVEYEKAKWALAMIEKDPVMAQRLVTVSPMDDHALHAAYFASKLQDPTYFTTRRPESIQLATQIYQQHTQLLSEQVAQQEQQQREQRDEEAYVKALIQHGGPGRSPPSLSLFPSALRESTPPDQPPPMMPGGSDVEPSEY